MKTPRQFRQIALFGKYQTTAAGATDSTARRALEEIAHFLLDGGFDVVVEADTAASMGMSHHATLDIAGIGRQCDLGLVVGGDGTMLGIGRQLAPFKVPLIGINQGRLGFITDIALDQYKTVLPPMLKGNYQEDQRSLIQAHVERDGERIFSALAMNEVVVNRGAGSGMVELRIEVDGHFVANQRADGLIISTPTGSTAYCLSAGGPLMHPGIDGWAIVPIAPHTLSNRPLVLANVGEVMVKIVSGRDVSANFDMQSLASLMQGDRIIVHRSEHKVRFLHPKGWTYFNTLRQKMHWNEGVA